MRKMLQVRNLSTSFITSQGETKAVKKISFNVERGEALGIIGESGCGKTTAALSIMRLLPSSGKITDGEVIFENQDILKLRSKDIRRIRGNRISMIYQDPMTALNPVLRIKEQLIETILSHDSKISRIVAYQRALHQLKMVKIPSAEEKINQYPMQLSGGMRQRVVIAMSLLNNPEILIADEPTTALDVTIQAQILDLMRQIQREMRKAIILITHDLGVVAEFCTRVIVMYSGIIVEEGTIEDIFYRPLHPYTIGLLNSLPYMDGDKIKGSLEPIPGSPPSPLQKLAGCPFAPRCKSGMKLCLRHMPDEVGISEFQKVKCFLYYPGVEAGKKKESRMAG